MAKKFGGFTEQQMEVLARKMGFNGPMESFNDFLSSNPASAAKLESYTNQAQKAVGEVPKFADGGIVVDPDGRTKKKSGGGEPAKKTNEDIVTPFEQQTNRMLNTKNKTVRDIKVNSPTVKEIDSGLIDKKSVANRDAETINHTATVDKTATANTAKEFDAATVDTATSQDKVEAATDGFEGAQGTVSDNAKVEAATAKPSDDATVQGQLKKLYQDFEGGEVPPWAAGAMRMANSVMASRGLGSSSMAGAAITQAAMESAFSIAVQDASTFAQFEMKNLDNRQQARLINAQSFLQMDLANLDNKQQAMLFNTQARVNSILSDAAAENATRQFNASSENQVNSFFAEMKTQVSQFNATQRNAKRQFNTNQKNTVKMFNAEQQNARDQFNANQRLVIDQSNAEWRRTITTTESAEVNENNRLEATLRTGLTEAAYNNLWQQERDLMSYAFTAAENAAQRANSIVLAKIYGKNNVDAARAGQDGDADAALYGVAGNVVGNVVNGVLGKVFGG